MGQVPLVVVYPDAAPSRPNLMRFHTALSIDTACLAAPQGQVGHITPLAAAHVKAGEREGT